MSSYSDRELLGLDQVEDLLEAYADARLSPARPVLARMRAHVTAQAATMAAIDGAARRVLDTGDAKPSRWSLPRLLVPRRAFSLVGAGLLTVGMTTAVLGAPAGSPFYNARVAIEAAFLPTQIDARAVAHEEYLAERLAEAEAAAARGDFVALDAALVAFQAEVDAAVADIGEDQDRIAHLEEKLAKHVTVLTELEVRLPDEANVEHALQSSQKAIEKIKAKGDHGGGKPSDKPGGQPDKPNGQQR